MIVLEILKVGISGLMFLLAHFSYRLISQEQQRPVPSDKILKNIRYYMAFCLISATLVGVLSTIPLFWSHSRGTASCRDSMSRLRTSASASNVTSDDLRAGIEVHATTCSTLFEE